MIEFQRVNMIFKSSSQAVHAVKDISFTLQPNEVLSVVGPSGCGKSTILRLAAGLEMPSSGKIYYKDTPLEGPERSRGFVFQSYSVFPWLTVRENVAFGLGDNITGENSKKIGKWLDFMELTDFSKAYPKALSGGMQQRLALARTMIVEPELLLLDEPFGALDEKTRDGMQKLLLRAVADTGCSVIFVTHNIQEAIFLADKLILLSKRPGTIIQTCMVSTPKPRGHDFLQSEEFIRLHNLLLDRFPV